MFGVPPRCACAELGGSSADWVVDAASLLDGTPQEVEGQVGGSPEVSIQVELVLGVRCVMFVRRCSALDQDIQTDRQMKHAEGKELR